MTLDLPKGALASAPDREDEDEIDVSIVLAVFNESGHVEAEIDRIRSAMEQSTYTYEIIVVDDGSTDGSPELVAAIRGIRLIRMPINRGSGSARREGTAAAHGRVVVWTDVDMTYPNERIPEVVAEVGTWDQVVGARTSEQGDLKFFRVPAKWLIRRLAEYLVETPIPDLNSGLRAFRRDVGDQFLQDLPPGFSCVTTITMSFLANGFTVGYIPIDYAPRAGTSKFHWWRDTKRYLLQVIRMVLSYNPLRVFLPLAMSLLLLATVKLGFDWYTRDFRLAANTLLLFFAGFQTLMVGLLADLVVRATKPRYKSRYRP